MSNGFDHEAEAALRALLREDQSNPLLHEQLAELYAQPDPARAVRHYLEAAKLYAEATHGQRKENLERAQQLLERAAELSDEDQLPLFRLAELLEQAGESERAEQLYQRLLPSFRLDQRPFYHLALLERIAALRPRDRAHRLRTAAAKERLGMRTAAARDYLLVAQADREADRHEDALRLLQLSLDIAPGLLDARQALAELQQQLSDPAAPLSWARLARDAADAGREQLAALARERCQQLGLRPETEAEQTAPAAPLLEGRVVLIDDEPLMGALAAAFFPATGLTLERLPDAAAALAAWPTDTRLALLASNRLGGLAAREAVAQLQERERPPAVLVIESEHAPLAREDVRYLSHQDVPVLHRPFPFSRLLHQLAARLPGLTPHVRELLPRDEQQAAPLEPDRDPVLDEQDEQALEGEHSDPWAALAASSEQAVADTQSRFPGVTELLESSRLRLRELEHERDQLARELAGLKRERELRQQTQRRLTEVETRLSSAEDQQRALRRARDEAQAAARQALGQVEEERAARTRERKLHDEQLDDARQRHRSEVEALGLNVQDLFRRLEEARSQLVTEREQAEAGALASQQRVEQLQAELDRLTERARQLESAHAAEVERLATRARQLESAHAAEAERVRQLERQLDHSGVQRQTLEQLTELELSQRRTLEQRLLAQGRELDRTRRALGQRERETGARRLQLERASARAAGMADELGSARRQAGERQRLATRLAAANLAQRSLQTERERAEKLARHAAQLTRRSQLRAGELYAAGRQLQVEIERRAQAQAEAESRLETLQAQLGELQTQLLGDREADRQRQARLERELSSASEAHRQLASERKRLDRELAGALAESHRSGKAEALANSRLEQERQLRGQLEASLEATRGQLERLREREAGAVAMLAAELERQRQARQLAAAGQLSLARALAESRGHLDLSRGRLRRLELHERMLSQRHRQLEHRHGELEQGNRALREQRAALLAALLDTRRQLEAERRRAQELRRMLSAALLRSGAQTRHHALESARDSAGTRQLLRELDTARSSNVRTRQELAQSNASLDQLEQRLRRNASVLGVRGRELESSLALERQRNRLLAGALTRANGNLDELRLQTAERERQHDALARLAAHGRVQALELTRDIGRQLAQQQRLELASRRLTLAQRRMTLELGLLREQGQRGRSELASEQTRRKQLERLLAERERELEGLREDRRRLAERLEQTRSERAEQQLLLQQRAQELDRLAGRQREELGLRQQHEQELERRTAEQREEQQLRQQREQELERQSGELRQLRQDLAQLHDERQRSLDEHTAVRHEGAGLKLRVEQLQARLSLLSRQLQERTAELAERRREYPRRAALEQQLSSLRHQLAGAEARVLELELAPATRPAPAPTPRGVRPLWLPLAALAGAVLTLLLARPQPAGEPLDSARPSPPAASRAVPPTAPAASPPPAAERAPVAPVDADAYQRIWERNTRKTRSDRVRIQATLRTPYELRAYYGLQAAREGWDQQRLEQAVYGPEGAFERVYLVDQRIHVSAFVENIDQSRDFDINSVASRFELELAPGLRRRAQVLPQPPPRVITTSVDGKPVIQAISLSLGFPHEGRQPARLSLRYLDEPEPPPIEWSWRAANSDAEQP